LVDTDPGTFTAEVLLHWKSERETVAAREIGLARKSNPGRLEKQNRKRSPAERKLLVKFAVGELVESGVNRTPKFIFTVSNPHQRPFTVWGAGVEAPEVGVSVPVIKPELSSFPHEVTDGQGFGFVSDIDYFVSQLRAKNVNRSVQVIGYVTDALGNRHVSEPVSFP
jgi:hypothetical protein